MTHEEICNSIKTISPYLNQDDLTLYKKYLTILENSISNNTIIKKIYNNELEKFSNCVSSNSFKKKNLLFLKLSDRLDSLDKADFNNPETLCSELAIAFYNYIMSHKRDKPSLRDKLQLWMDNICKFLKCNPRELAIFPPKDSLNFYELFQQGYSVPELCNITKLSAKRLSQIAPDYGAFLCEDNKYRITDIHHQPKLHLNTTEIGCLLLSLCISYNLKENNEIRKSPPEQILRIALNIWKSISVQTRDRLKEKYGNNKYNKMESFYHLLDERLDEHNSNFFSESIQAQQRKKEKLDQLSFAFKSSKPLDIIFSDVTNDNKLTTLKNCYVNENIFQDKSGIGIAKTIEDKNRNIWIFVKYNSILEVL